MIFENTGSLQSLAQQVAHPKNTNHTHSTPGRDRTCRFPIWRRVFRHWNFRRVVLAHSSNLRPATVLSRLSSRCAGKESNLQLSRRDCGVTARCITILPPARRTKPSAAISVEGFEPSTPCARGIPARRDCQTAPHAAMRESGRDGGE